MSELVKELRLFNHHKAADALEALEEFAAKMSQTPHDFEEPVASIRQDKQTTPVGSNANVPCPQCGAEPREAHREWDSIARCFESGQQLIACDEDHERECSPSVWDGEYPGVKQCRGMGLFIDDPEFGRSEDLNKFAGLPKEWNRDTQSWDIPDWVKVRLRG